MDVIGDDLGVKINYANTDWNFLKKGDSWIKLLQFSVNNKTNPNKYNNNLVSPSIMIGFITLLGLNK